MNKLSISRQQDRAEIGRFCVRGSWTLLLVGFLLGMSYLWLYSQVMQSSRSMESCEQQLAYLSGRNVILQSRLEALSSPSSIIRMLEEREIALADPTPEQIVRVRREESPPAARAARARPPRDLVILSIAR